MTSIEIFRLLGISIALYRDFWFNIKLLLLSYLHQNARHNFTDYIGTSPISVSGEMISFSQLGEYEDTIDDNGAAGDLFIC